MNIRFYITWIWQTSTWRIRKRYAFNNGNEYTAYRFGPIYLMWFHHGLYQHKKKE